jgi:hypothetical protein
MKTLLAGGMLILALSAIAHAQRSNTSAPPQPSMSGSVWTRGSVGEMMGRDPSVYSRSFTGTIREVNPTSGLVVVEYEGHGRFSFIVNDDARIRADKDTELAGRKDLTLNDYKPGQRVKIIYRVSDRNLLELRLKKPKS